jgi:antitoxin PrlF
MRPVSKLTSKFQATIPAPVRAALRVKAGDAIAFEIRKDNEVTLRRATPTDLAFARALEGTLSEWDSAEDERAYRDL